MVITRDDRIRYRPAERQALLDANVLAFIISAKNLSTAEIAELLVQALPAMIRLAVQVARPAIYRIGRNAKPIAWSSSP